MYAPCTYTFCKMISVGKKLSSSLFDSSDYTDWVHFMELVTGNTSVLKTRPT